MIEMSINIHTQSLRELKKEYHMVLCGGGVCRM